MDPLIKFSWYLLAKLGDVQGAGLEEHRIETDVQVLLGHPLKD